MTLHGVAASAGIGMGRAVIVRETELDYAHVSFAGEAAETARFEQAVETFTRHTQAMAEDVKARAGEKEAEILEGQIAMLNDPFLLDQVKENIQQGRCAEASVDAVCTMYTEMFAGMDDEMMRQRAADVRDIRTRMLEILLGVHTQRVADVPAGSVLVARDLTPSMTVGIRPENVAAILTEAGSRTSHSAILARALQIPAVLGIHGLLDTVRDGDAVIADGDAGEALLNADGAVTAQYEARRLRQQEQRAGLEKWRSAPTRDADGAEHKLYANIGGPAEAKIAAAEGAEGIGLFRTEFLFMGSDALPTEQEQYEAYAAAADAFPKGEVIIRTLDVGGDKDIPYLALAREENPFLGYRAIRYCLDRPDVFRVQLRALLRAGAKHGNVRIMLPLVTSVQEVRAARELLETCKQQLAAEGIAYDANIRVGVMIETPAAAQTADLLAREADFFSIGTNDLTQYTLAVDRGNPKVENLYSVFHPAVLRSIRGVITAARAAHIPVGMCGEAAADVRLTPLWLAFGLDEFSVSAAAVTTVRAAIAHWSAQTAQETAEKAMAQESADAVKTLLCADAPH